jgi:hypothetical protein
LPAATEVINALHARHEGRKPFAGRMKEGKTLRVMAGLPLARCRPYQSLALVLSIVNLVAAASKEAVHTVGESMKWIAAGQCLA